MNHVQIECFLLTAAFQSYTRTAENLHLSQPTVSRYIANLEDELKCQLLKRTTKKVELTDDGQIYYSMFSRWQMELKEIQRRVESTKYKLRFGYMEGWVMQKSVQDSCNKFAEEYPDIEIEFVCMGNAELMDGLLKGDLDIALVLDNPQMDMACYSKKKVRTLKKVLLYSRHHKLADKQDLKLKDFENETFFVLGDDGNYALKKNLEFCMQYQFRPFTRSSDNVQTIHMNVQNGQGVAIIDEWGPGCYKETFRTLPILSEGEIYLVWKNPLVKKEVQLFAEYFKIES